MICQIIFQFKEKLKTKPNLKGNVFLFKKPLEIVNLSTAEIIYPEISMLRFKHLKGYNLGITFYLQLLICWSIVGNDYV